MENNKVFKNLPEFGAEIGRLVRERGMLQQDLCGPTQMHKSDLSNLIHGKHRPVADVHIKSISQQLGILPERIRPLLKWPNSAALPGGVEELQLTTKVGKTASRIGAVGKAARWEALCNSAYAPRPDLVEGLARDFDAWWSNKDSDENDSDRIPVFWLHGRSGDGKSVAMLQLVEHILKTGSGLRFGKSDTAKLHETYRQLGERSDVVLVVDDLHRLLGDTDSIDILRELAATCRTPILTCGPTPEYEQFGRLNDIFAVKPGHVRPATAGERSDLCQWLGKAMPKEATEDGLLVELLFEIDVGSTLTQFARNFRQRAQLAGLESRLLTVLALNAIGLPADPKLLDDRGSLFFNRLAASDQRHFERIGVLPDGRSGGITFSHKRIAWRVFADWPTDVIASLEDRLGIALTPAFQLCHDELVPTYQLVLGLFVRSTELSGMDLGKAVRAVAMVLESLQKERVRGDQLIFAAFQIMCVERPIRCGGSESLLKTAEDVAVDQCAEATYRAPLCAYLTFQLQDARQPDGRQRKVVQALLGEDLKEFAPNAIILMHEYLGLREKFPSLPDDWLKLYGDGPSASPLHTYRLGRNPRPVHIGAARDWVLKSPDAPGASNVWVKLFLVPHDGEDVRRAFDWARTHAHVNGVANVWNQLVISAEGNEPIAEAAMDWAWQNPQKPGASNVWENLIEKATPQRLPDVADAVIGWLSIEPPPKGRYAVWSILLGRDASLADRALPWLAERGGDGAELLWTRLVTLAKGDVTTRDAALDWATRGHGSGLAKFWASTVHHWPDEPEVISLAERYATTSADAAGVWIKLLESESVSERVEAALAWVRAFPDANGSFGVWGKVLLAEGFPIARSNEALDWIQNATSRAGIRPLLRQLISNSEGAVLDRAVETACQLLPEVDDRHRADFLAPLLSRLDPEHPRFASFHEAFCNLPTSGEKSNAAFEILRKLVRQRAPQPRIDSAIALCTNEAFAKRAIHHRAKLLAQMLEDPEFTTGVVETMIRLRDKGRQQPQTHSFLWSIANLTAFYASDAILAAASIRPPNEAEDLLIMLADSTIGDPKRRAAILALRQRWPRAHLDVFRRVERENPRQSRIQ